jgi:hypothetical protein
MQTFFKKENRKKKRRYIFWFFVLPFSEKRKEIKSHDKNDDFY